MFRQRSFRFLIVVPVLFLVLLLLSLGPKPDAQAAFGDRITVSGSQFMAGGQRIWINGANTPWNNWNDFGGNYNASWWDSHFQQLHDAGINATRVWITCSGEVGINISDAGYVSGATDKHWQDLDSFFQIARQRQIYIMATLISFDHFKNTYSTYPKWRNMLQNNANIDSYVNNYVIPFVNRYESNPYVWSIDLINEPDWVHENTEVGQFAWDPLQEYWARAARAIHENSPILVTVGMGMPKYNSGSCSGCEGNVIADSALRAKVNDPEVYIDFYSSHYYPWQDPYFGGIPFYKSPTAYYGADPGKPSMIGETPATGSTGHTLTQDYENAYLNGWQGVMPWTSNGVDSNGGFAQVSPATDAFRDNHPSLVFPGGTPPPTTPPPTTPPPTTPPPTTPPPTTPPPTTPPPSGNTGWISPTAQAAQSGGDGNGFQTSPTSAFADDSAFATDTDSGNGTSTSCTSTNKDRHAYYAYPISIPAGATINGIEVRLDSRADSTSGSPRHCVQLSWNNGSSWTTAKQTGTLTTSMASRTLGSASDNWGRTWTTGELTSATLWVRIANVASSTSRDFFLDWVPVRVTYSGATPPPTTPPPTGAGITTGQASNIAADRAVLNSTSTITGSPQQVVVSYAYWETSNPAVVTTVSGQTYSGVGNFYDEVLVTGLKASTQYTYHAIGRFMFEGTITARDVTFTTTAPPTTPPPTTPPPTTPPPGSACSPVTSTISAPFTFDGPGTFCWQASSLGTFVNSWNLVSLTINGVDFTNRWAGSGSYPPPINGFWYISYQGSFPWSHFEAK